MARNAKIASITFASAFFCGCAHLPDATITYYLARSKVEVEVTRTVACDASKNFVVDSTARVTSIHSADLDGEKHRIDLAKLQGPFSNATADVSFYSDGRLKGINAANTGQGEAILKTTASVLGRVVGGFTLMGLTDTDECGFIKEAGDGKPLVLKYRGIVDVEKPLGEKQAIGATTRVYQQRLGKEIGDVYAVIESIESPKPEDVVIELRDDAYNGEVLLARQPGVVTISVMAGEEKIWEGPQQVGQFGREYTIPMPKPAAFGNLDLSVSFDESGAVSKLSYTRDQGTSQVLAVADAAMQKETAAEEALKVKAEADLIAQQQRLTQCRADPANCK